MKIDFSQSIRKLDGTEVKKEDKTNFTLADVACEAVLSEPEGKKYSGQEKSRRYALAIKIHGHNNLPLELSVEDIVLIKEGIAEIYAPLVSGQAWDMFDKQDKKDKKE